MKPDDEAPITAGEVVVMLLVIAASVAIVIGGAGWILGVVLG